MLMKTRDEMYFPIIEDKKQDPMMMNSVLINSSFSLKLVCSSSDSRSTSKELKE